MRALFSLCGYDATLIDRVGKGERVFFAASALLSLVAAVLAGAGMAYGADLTLGAWSMPFAFIAAFAFIMNLLRLQHAATGYPIHLPIEAIDEWRPAMMGIVILAFFGVLIGQPLVFLCEKPWLDPTVAARAEEARALRASLGLDGDINIGLISRARAAWDEHAALSALLTVIFGGLVASPAILRRLGTNAVQDYESERWIADRILVDDEWAEARDIIEAELSAQVSWFEPPLKTPFADPPYNTRPLVFGLDPASFVEGRIKFVRLKRADRHETPALPTPQRPWWADVSFEPKPLSAKASPAPPPETPTTTPTSEAPAPSAVSAQSLTVMDVARMTAAVARTDARAMALCVRYLDIAPNDVVTALRDADGDTLVHTVFPAWNKLPTVLLKTAGEALGLGIVPLVAVAIGRPADQTERRLRAVPPTQKLSSVFAPELARRLLREKT